MTTTAPPRPTVADGRGRLPAPVRDRRPALAALALLLVLVGGLTSALVADRSGDRVDVLVARVPIEVGQTIERADFGVARVAADGASVIEAAAETTSHEVHGPSSEGLRRWERLNLQRRP